MEHVFKFFKKLKKETGSSINLEKTKLLPINTDQISIIQKNIPNITILKRYQYIKILGVYFSEDLKNTIITNWQQTKNKMENHIKKLSSRTLSLSGKATIINTLLLSKTTFLSNFFPLPEETITKIYPILFNYLWNNKNLNQLLKKHFFSQKKKKV